MAESKKYRIYLATLFGKDLDIKSIDVSGVVLCCWLTDIADPIKLPTASLCKRLQKYSYKNVKGRAIANLSPSLLD